VIHRTTLVRVEHGGDHYLVSLAGESEWVCNVRASEGRAVLGRRCRRAVTLEPVPVAARPAVIRSYLRRSGRRARSWGTAGEARHYFGIPAEPSDDELRRIAGRYPVFLVRYAGGTVPGGSR
jgi:hypothetical protein